MTIAVEPEQDADWAARCRRRLRIGLEILGEEAEPMKLTDLQDLAAAREPLTAYDLSLTTNNGVRAWINFGWNLTTTYEHPGWLHATSEGGFRLTAQGRAALATYPDPQELYDVAVTGYKDWDAARNEILPDVAADPSTDVLHGGSGAAHALRGARQILDAWRSGGSAFVEDGHVWTLEQARSLREYFDSAPPSPACNSPGVSLVRGPSPCRGGFGAAGRPTERHGREHQAEPRAQPLDPGDRSAGTAMAHLGRPGAGLRPRRASAHCHSDGNADFVRQDARPLVRAAGTATRHRLGRPVGVPGAGFRGGWS
ncbi:hypothetical protein G5V58_18360 [Nocardioides anomalus]|uniref:Uncharacterized protein n=1 Tax=Nocardioides anomalus TaxID=2712223 RepID=A0A6G6WHB9_9ACTN|nr:hypothetical protein G5V58_18360 [Nocardioides anomalus]